jgi:putative membrane protein
LTTLSTTFIVASGICLAFGWVAIRYRRNPIQHRNMMLAATSLAGLFLVTYIWRWSVFGSKPFEGQGIWRTIYLTVLIPHILLAIAVGPMAGRLIYLAAFKKDFAAHRRLARVVLPIWLFVAGSGWFIFYMLWVAEF